jgi:trans-aconitate methyltransferase
MDANPYVDQRRAEAYATLEVRGTYYLAYRDLPEILASHVNGTRAIDFGCGAGRSTRLLDRLGFDVVGVDIAPEMIANARQLDPSGDYRLLDSRGLSAYTQLSYDLVLSCFPFDNIPGDEQKITLLTQLQ